MKADGTVAALVEVERACPVRRQSGAEGAAMLTRPGTGRGSPRGPTVPSQTDPSAPEDPVGGLDGDTAQSRPRELQLPSVAPILAISPGERLGRAFPILAG